ncbi:hypothetical protein CFE70_006041 [Pyrenophora teres f. teres 0-1]|nr:hypothetical protein HRS9139_02857 [Pyrenophora teres f. teres]KAE8844439.1 hypothetical protein PTNB85_02704 [Pyrenophora teres f. teres]KAE8866414.1 hypothetical protein PTNB29_03561 [Pyrenophora teres f. teres]CAE7179278.1 hypothetical protein PTTW11_06520 [Pyrenophora teres f. teres]
MFFSLLCQINLRYPPYLLSDQLTDNTTTMSEEQQQTLRRSASAQSLKEREEKMILRIRPHPFENVAHFEAPFFTRALLQRVASEVELARKGNCIIEMPHILGGGVTKLQLESRIATAVSLSWYTTMKIAEYIGKTPGYVITPHYLPSTSRYTDSETLKGPIEMLTPDDSSYRVWKLIQQMPIPPSMDDGKVYENEVLMSKLWRDLPPRLDALTVRIENIVCAALGAPFLDGKKSYRSVTQHLLACSVSRYLSQLYAKDSGDAPSIPILAHDPVYTFEDVCLLWHLKPPITVVSDPYHYLAITPSTLVIIMYAPKTQPILEIVADVCFPSTPAAILSLEIRDYPWHKKSLVTTLDPWTPRVGKMLEGMDSVWLQGEEGVGNRVDQEYGRYLHWYTRKG